MSAFKRVTSTNFIVKNKESVLITKTEEKSIWLWSDIAIHLDFLKDARFRNDDDLQKLVIAIKALIPSEKESFIAYIKLRNSNQLQINKVIELWNEYPNKISSLLIGIIMHMIIADGRIVDISTLILADLKSFGSKLTINSTITDMADAFNSASKWRIILIKKNNSEDLMLTMPLIECTIINNEVTELQHYMSEITFDALEKNIHLMILNSVHSQNVNSLTPLILEKLIPLLTKTLTTYPLKYYKQEKNLTITNLVDKHCSYVGAKKRNNLIKCLEAEELIKLVEPYRLKNITVCKTLASVLRTIDDDLKQIFINLYERLSPMSLIDIVQIWNNATINDNINAQMVLLHSWAKIDNPVNYAKFENDKNSRIMQEFLDIQNPSTNDLAICLHRLCNYKYFTAVSQKGLVWGEFQMRDKLDSKDIIDNVLHGITKIIYKELIDKYYFTAEKVISTVPKIAETNLIDSIHKVFEYKAITKQLINNSYDIPEDTLRNSLYETSSDLLEGEIFSGLDSLYKLQLRIKKIISNNSKRMINQVKEFIVSSANLTYTARENGILYNFGMFIHNIPKNNTSAPTTKIQKKVVDQIITSQQIINTDDISKCVNKDILTDIRLNLIHTILEAIKDDNIYSLLYSIDIITDDSHLRIICDITSSTEMVITIGKGQDSLLIPSKIINTFIKENEQLNIKKNNDENINKTIKKVNYPTVTITDLETAFKLQEDISFLVLTEENINSFNLNTINEHIKNYNDCRIYFYGSIGAFEYLKDDIRNAIKMLDDRLQIYNSIMLKNICSLDKRTNQERNVITNITKFYLKNIIFPQIDESWPISKILALINKYENDYVNCDRYIKHFDKIRNQILDSENKLIQRKNHLSSI